MRIAQISPLAEAVPPRLYGGTERVVSWLTEELVRLGHEVTLFASGDSLTEARLVPCVSQALRLAGVKDFTANNLVMLDKVRKRADEFDIIHCHVDMLQFPLFQAMPNKLITTLHGRLDLPDYWPIYEAYPHMPLVSISDNQRKPMPPDINWLATIHHGLPEHVCPFNAAGGEYLAFLGRISPEKRPDRAIEIAKRSGILLKIAAKVDKVDLDYFNELIKPMLDHPLIDFIGEIDERQKCDFLGNALGLLFPIDWMEPFGLVMIEAMSAGTPVIAWRNGSVPEVIANDKAGIIVESMDEAVAAVERLHQLKRRGVRDYFESRFTVKRMAWDYLAAYEAMINQSSKRKELIAAE
ncbi:MAG: glycosyltransferase family 4 protein [Alphaproteobacteria bacterium]|nr:glycosyltransferase family 4 protein [Alphaproteobacteria bacterium]